MKQKIHVAEENVQSLVTMISDMQISMITEVHMVLQLNPITGGLILAQLSMSATIKINLKFIKMLQLDMKC